MVRSVLVFACVGRKGENAAANAATVGATAGCSAAAAGCSAATAVRATTTVQSAAD